MRSRVVRPELAVVSLAQGDTLTLKRQLTAGETRAASASLLRLVDGLWVRDPMQMGLANVLAYLVDWTLVDPDGRLIEIRGQPRDVVTSALDSLDMESFNEIARAVEGHELAMLAERETEKKSQAGAPRSSRTSTSPDAAAGATNGSPSSTPTSTLSSVSS